MNGRVVRIGLWVLVTLGLLAGCVDNNRSLVITRNVALDESCEYETDRFKAAGMLDLDHPWYGGFPVYFLFPEINNYMPSNLDPDNYELDATSVQTEKITITYQWLEGPELLENNPNPEYQQALLLEGSEEEVFFTVVVDSASETGDPGQVIMVLPILSRDIGATLARLGADVVDIVLGARVQLFGQTLGGINISSNPFNYPIYFCRGCLNFVCCGGTADAYYPACWPGQDNNALTPCECP